MRYSDLRKGDCIIIAGAESILMLTDPSRDLPKRGRDFLTIDWVDLSSSRLNWFYCLSDLLPESYVVVRTSRGGAIAILLMVTDQAEERFVGGTYGNTIRCVMFPTGTPGIFYISDLELHDCYHVVRFEP